MSAESSKDNNNHDFQKQFTKAKDSQSIGLDSLEDNGIPGLQDSFEMNMADFSDEIKK